MSQSLTENHKQQKKCSDLHVDYDLGYRDKQAKYEGLIMVYNKNKGIYRKSSTRKDWFVFTNSAYREAMEGTNTNNKKGGMSKKEYKNLQQQIDSLQKQLNKNPKPSQASQKAKSIEKKADEGNLKHKHITKELRLQIQQARNSKGLTQKQLANNCQLTQQIINDIESGKAIYNHQHINKIKRHLKIK